MGQLSRETMAERAAENDVVGWKGTSPTEQPAVGLVATPDNGDALARALLRATQRGHQVLVTYRGDVPEATIDLLESGGARLVEPPAEATGPNDLEQVLSTTARALSFPGLLFHDEGHDPIDYEATMAAFDRETYCVDAAVTSGTSSRELAGALVAIPAYEEAAAIGGVVAAAREHADDVLVVDDGSGDGTAARAREAGATVIEHGTNGGYGTALKTAFRAAEERRAERLVVLDGDGQHDPADIPRLVGALRDGDDDGDGDAEGDGTGDADVVIGSRFAPGSETAVPLYRWLGLVVVNVLTNLSFGVVRSASWVGDTQSGFRAYSRRAIASLAADKGLGDRMGASTDILHHAHHHDYAITRWTPWDSGSWLLPFSTS
jgi:hypothetical protein